MNKKANALTRTLAEVKADIAKGSQELEAIAKQIANKRKELAAVHDLISQKRSELVALSESAGTIYTAQANSLRDAISQRNQVAKSLKMMEKARMAVELEIAERRKVTYEVKGLNLGLQAIKQARETLSTLTNKVQTAEAVKNKVEAQVAKLSNLQKKLFNQKDATEKLVSTLEMRFKKLNEKREAVVKELARETAKMKEIRARERDVRVMHKRLTDEYKNAYKYRNRRSTI